MTAQLRIDEQFVARLMLGALSDHEQRLLAVRLLRYDPEVRLALLAVVEPFQMYDIELMAEYSRALASRGEASAEIRVEILQRSFDMAPNLEDLIRRFTYDDVFALGRVSRKLFTWSMAELLLKRGRQEDQSSYNAKTNLQLSLMVIDVVDILGASGHSPYYVNVIQDVRRRIFEAREQQELLDDDGEGRDAERS